jgi:prepilin-type N-terminal cleavage/methylation domain-containing protein
MSYSLKCPSIQSGFSLVELLMVMAIIAILSFVGLSSMQGNSASASLGSGEAQAASLMQSARNLAILKNTSTRLLVSNDLSNGSGYLRSMAVVYSSVNSSGVTVWTSATKVESLPQGIFFNADRSGKVSAEILTMNLTVPATAATEGTGPAWYYYEFAASGATGNNGAEGFILMAGHLISSSQVVYPNANLVRGFLIRRLGALAYYEEPNQIPQ